MSLVTYPVATAPRTFLPASFSARAQVNQRAFASPFGGSEQAVDLLNDRWQFSLELGRARSHAEAAQIEAFINALRGQVNHTELYHFGRPLPLGTLASSQGLLYDAAQGADSITIATTAGATLLAGDMLSVDGLLVQCREACTADANGVLVVPLTSRLRRAINGLRRASTATYVDGAGVVQTVAVDVARFQGGALLVEPAATNMVMNSGNADLWNKSAGGTGLLPVTTANFAAAPDGAVSASRVIFDTGAGTTLTDQSAIYPFGVNTITGTPTSAFVWLKSNTAESYNVRVEFNGANSTDQATFPNTVTVTPVWTRFEIRNASPSNAFHRLTIRLRGTFTGNYADILVWGGQQENTAAATSYIPTTTAAATRAADVVSPVVSSYPTAPFRLVSSTVPRYVAGYADAVSLDFVEKVD